MSLAAVEQALEARVRNQVERIYNIPVYFGQAGFSKGDTEWLRVAILGGLDITQEIDNTSWETSGTLQIQIFTKPGQRRRNAEIYDYLVRAFRQQDFSDVHTTDPERIVLGDSNGWWQTNFSVEWETLEVI